MNLMIWWPVEWLAGGSLVGGPGKHHKFSQNYGNLQISNKQTKFVPKFTKPIQIIKNSNIFRGFVGPWTLENLYNISHIFPRLLNFSSKCWWPGPIPLKIHSFFIMRLEPRRIRFGSGSRLKDNLHL